ncbi:MAG: M28 family peptidase [Hyphomonadaceae bacterium]
MRLPALLAILTLAGCAPAPTTKPIANVAPVVVDQLLEDVRILSADDMQGRLIGTPGSAKARAYILDRFRQIGISPLPGMDLENLFSVEHDGKTVIGANVVGFLPGTAGSDRTLLIMAHYDHLGVRDGQIYNGADDNASGVAAVLQLAASLRQTVPLHGVVVAIVDGEEEGFVGSRSLVRNPKFSETLGKVVLVVNVDMVSRSNQDELYVSGGYHFPFLMPLLEGIAKNASVKLLLGHDRPEQGHDDWTDQSDHFAFQEIHRPWVYFGVEDHPDYHEPTDDFTMIPVDFFHRSMATIELAVRTFDRDLEAIAEEASSQAPH